LPATIDEVDMSKKITKIGIMTSGGDAPGMNACVRAVVRTGLFHKLEVFGITRGYAGISKLPGARNS